MQKLNKNNFIPRALEIHNGKYSYTKTVYVKAKENGCKLFRLKYDYTNKDYLELCSLIKECKKGGTLDGNK